MKNFGLAPLPPDSFHLIEGTEHSAWPHKGGGCGRVMYSHVLCVEAISMCLVRICIACSLKYWGGGCASGAPPPNTQWLIHYFQMVHLYKDPKGESVLEPSDTNLSSTHLSSHSKTNQISEREVVSLKQKISELEKQLETEVAQLASYRELSSYTHYLFKVAKKCER